MFVNGWGISSLVPKKRKKDIENHRIIITMNDILQQAKNTTSRTIEEETTKKRTDRTLISNETSTIIHEYFMKLALQQAKLAEEKGEVPVGAIIVQRRWATSTNPTSNHNDIRDDEYDDGEKDNTSKIYGYEYRIVSAAHNLVETNQDASAHAELLALRLAAHNHDVDQNQYHSQYHSKGKVIQSTKSTRETTKKVMKMKHILWDRMIRRRRGMENIHDDTNNDKVNNKNWRLGDNTTLYCTLEPCPMCLAAAQAFRVTSIVYGAPDLRIGAIETHMKMLDDYVHPYHIINKTDGNVISGILANESTTMLKQFFKKQRKLQKEHRKQQQQQQQQNRTR